MKLNEHALNIFQWNCRSLKGNLAYMIEFIANSKNTHHVLCLQSVNMKFSELPRIEGYYYPPAVSNRHKKVSTATYINTQCSYIHTKSPIANIENVVYSTAIQMTMNSKPHNIINLYYPQGLTKNQPELIDWLTTLNNDEGWIILGDFNTRHPNWEYGLKTPLTGANLLLQTITDSNLVLINDGTPTRLPDITTHSLTAPDLTLVSANLATDSDWAVFEDPLRSDHCPILTSIETELTYKPTNNRPGFNYDKADWVLFRNVLNQTCIQTKGNIEESYQNIRTAILTAARKAIPTYGNYKETTKTCPWWNDECQRAVKEKRKHYKTYLKHPNADTFTQRKEAEATCGHTVAKAKLEYFKQINDKVSDYTGLTEVWKRLKAVKRRNVHYEHPLTHNGITTKNNKEKANLLAQTFANASQSNSLPKEEKKRRLAKGEVPDPPAQNDLVFNAVLTKRELLTVLKEIKSLKKSTGPDLISYVILGNLPDRTIEVLLKFYQRCWEEGDIPQAWRTAEVVGIPKPGKPKKSPENYRPISLTPHLGKVYERILNKRLNYFLEKNNIIPKCQSGFRKHRSCADHLVALSTHIKKALAKRRKVFATFFDIKGAYDSVWHNKLLSKLVKIGISGRMYNFIKKFLNNRSMRVKVGNDLSQEHKIDMGVPQGSIMAPTLFNIMLYDITKLELKKSSQALFADDLAIWREVNSGRNEAKALKEHQEDMDRITVYMFYNGFTLSVTKTVFIVFNRKRRKGPKLSTHLFDTKIEESDQVKFLGVIFTRTLNWQSHVDHVTRKSTPALNLLKAVAHEKWATDPKVLTTLVGSLIRSRLLYGCQAFFTLSDSQLKTLCSVETRALKIALDIPTYARNKLVYKTLDWLPLEQEMQRRCTNYIIRAQNPTNPTQTILMQASQSNGYSLKKHAPSFIAKTVTISDFCYATLSGSGVDLADLIQPASATIPLWEVVTPTIDLSLSETSKKDQPNILCYKAKEKVLQMSHCLQVFTDGSKIKNMVGSAFVLPQLDIKKAYTLKQNHSIFTAELWAIYMCLDFLNAMPSPPLKVAIFSDSKAAVLAVKNNTRAQKNMLHDIYHIHNQLHLKGTEVTFVWIPSHMGIKGNDMADTAAKEAALGKAGTPINLGLCPLEAQNVIKHTMKSAWRKSVCEKRNTYSNSRLQLLYKAKGCLFRQLPPSRRKVILRILTDASTSKFNPVSCQCGQYVNIEHVFSDCPTMLSTFKTLKDKFNRNGTKYTLENCISEGPNGWGPLEWTADAICLSSCEKAF